MLKKKIYIIILMIIIILGIHIESLGFSLLANVNQNTLEENKLQIFLQLSALQDYSKGINVVSGKLIYDNNIFESVSFKGINNWSCAYNNEQGNENEGKFILMTTSGNAIEDKEVVQIKLKLKPNIEQQNTTIRIEGIETSYNSQKIKAEDKEINLEINGNNIKVLKNTNNVKENISLDIEEKQKQSYNVYITIAVIIIILVIIMMIIIKNLKKRGEISDK